MVRMSTAHQFAVSSVFVHKREKVTGGISVLRGASELSASPPRRIAAKICISGKRDSVCKVIKKHGGR